MPDRTACRSERQQAHHAVDTGCFEAGLVGADSKDLCGVFLADTATQIAFKLLLQQWNALGATATMTLTLEAYYRYTRMVR